MTLQDETGVVRAVVWRDLGELQRKTLLCSHLLAVTGKVERDGDVTHIIAQGLEDYSALLGRLQAESRDFR